MEHDQHQQLLDQPIIRVIPYPESSNSLDSQIPQEIKISATATTVTTAKKKVDILTLFRTSKTRVVGLKRKNGRVLVDCEIYIGRECKRGGWNLEQSIWANPFTVTSCGGDISVAIKKFETHLMNSPALLNRIGELKGKVLGCWCKSSGAPHAPCHGDILARLADATT